MALTSVSKRALALYLLRKNRRRCRKYWVHPINELRLEYGEYHRLCIELENYPDRYFQYLRMAKSQFDVLLSQVENGITKQDTNYRKCIVARERLVITLRILATGMSFRDAHYRYRMGEATIGQIVNETCSEICRIMMPKYIPEPDEVLWEKICYEFYEKWNIPNCLGAVDGKHISIFAPGKSGSKYFNYKGHFSIVLMAVVDASYKYVAIDVGAYGGNSDGGVFGNSNFGHSWLTNSKQLQKPKDRPLPQTQTVTPLVLVADEAFPLRDNIIRPFPGKNLTIRERVFNYRLSRARRVVENAFGISSHVWRILLKRMEVDADFASLITVTCCVLHNFLAIEKVDNNNYKASANNYYEKIDNERTVKQSGRYTRPTRQAIDVRNSFADWFVSPAGEVPWQYEIINK